MKSCRPNLVVAGAARSGTTALVRALEKHPDVFFICAAWICQDSCRSTA